MSKWYWSTLGALAATLVLNGCGGKARGPEPVRAQLDAALPDGISSERAVSILDSLQVEHSGYNPESRRILAIARNTSRTATTRGALQVELRFDAQGRLQQREFREVLTGP